MTTERDPLESIRSLVGETRAVRMALHDLIDRMRHDRREWERALSTIARRPRLTSPQRQRLRERLSLRARGLY